MESGEDSQDLPPVPDDRSRAIDDCRLWIGNLDQKVTEFSLLKVLQKFGSLNKFDFLYHKSGPDAGKPRGYCFVTYSSKEEAQKARKSLHGKLAMNKRLVVRPALAEAKEPNKEGVQKYSATGNTSKSSQIQAIEAKLKLMSKSEDLSSFQPKDKSKSVTASTSRSSNQGTSNCKKHSSNCSKPHSQKPYSKSSSSRKR